MRPSTALYLPASLLVMLLACADKAGDTAGGGGSTSPSEITDPPPGDSGGEAEGICMECPEDLRIAAEDCDGDGLKPEGGGELDPDDCDTDSDDDGLTDAEELTACKDDPSSDEEGTPSDLTSADTDSDGLSDGDEVRVYGTNPCLTDSDEDGLEDADELPLGLNPADEDTDGDTHLDGEEVEWDATGAMALDVNQPNLDATVGMPMPCEVGAEHKTSQHFPLTDTYYLGRDIRGYDFTECACTYTITDTRLATVTGVTVTLAKSAHQGSDWESDPEPAAVAIETPSAIASTAQVSDNNNGVWDGSWYAFDVDSSKPDEGGDYDLYPDAPVSAAGTYTVYVTRTNPTKDSIDTCERIGAYTNADGATSAMTLTIDGTVPTPLASPPPPMCTPGATSRSQVRLFDLGQGAKPFLRGGASALGGAKAREINVTNWRGAQFLRLRAGSTTYLLTPARPQLVLPGEGLDLAGLTWEAVTEAGSQANPDLSILHTCATGAPRVTPPAQAALSWTDIESMMARLMPGFTLTALGLEPADRSTPFVTLNLIQDPSGATLLELDQPGIGRLAAWPATAQDNGPFRVTADGPGYRLELVIFPRPWGLDLRLAKSTIATLAGPISVGPAQFQLRTPVQAPVGGGN